jgi:hypothetical protein
MALCADGAVLTSHGRSFARAASTSDVVGTYLRRFLAESFPAVATGGHVEVEAEWTGVLGFTKDGKPIVGPMATRPNVLVAAGFCGHGMCAPAASACRERLPRAPAARIPEHHISPRGSLAPRSRMKASWCLFDVSAHAVRLLAWRRSRERSRAMSHVRRPQCFGVGKAIALMLMDRGEEVHPHIRTAARSSRVDTGSAEQASE